MWMIPDLLLSHDSHAAQHKQRGTNCKPFVHCGFSIVNLIRLVELAHHVRNARVTGIIDSDYGATEG